MIGVICALRLEATPLRSRLVNRASWRLAGRFVTCGEIAGHSVALLVCGFGKVKAAAGAQLMIDRFPIRSLFMIGSAGAIDPSRGVGDLVIGRETFEYDFAPGQKGLERSHSTDPELVATALDAATGLGWSDRVIAGRILTADRTVSDEEVRRDLARRYSGQCCDWESAAVASVARTCRIPYLVIRGITDNAGGGVKREFVRNLGPVMKRTTDLLEATLRRI